MKAHSLDIPINAETVGSQTRSELEQSLSGILKSTDFRLSDDGSAFSLTGIKRSYHDLDPDLDRMAAKFGVHTKDDLRRFRLVKANHVIFFEDYWTAYYLAALFAQSPVTNDLIVLHFDDHADIMSTLLVGGETGTLVDPATNTVFDPSDPHSWQESFETGAVTIGSYFTPLFHHFAGSSALMHIRHVRETPVVENTTRDIHAAFEDYDLIPGLRFATTQESDENNPDGTIAGSYAEYRTARNAVRDLPHGNLIVHIDLDYFLNDLGGNLGSRPAELTEPLKHEIGLKMIDMREAISLLDREIVQWLIATSPGFCASRHWPWLMEELVNLIEETSVDSA